jgi:ectoine hydroxylase-related dioxygenase (phytanoyl-CoA dioxygenase family)
MSQLRVDQLKTWQESGAIFPLDLFSAEEAHAVATEFSRLFEINSEAVHKGFSMHTLSSKTMCVTDLAYAPFYRIARNRTLVEYIATLIGPEIYFLWGTAFFKEPSRFVFPWHTGRTSFPTMKAHISGERLYGESVTAVIALDEATEENGCITFIAGSHKYTDAEVKNQIGLQEGRRPRRSLDYINCPLRPTPILLDPGQVALLSEATVHGSGRNLSSLTRRSLSLRFFSGNVKPSPEQVLTGLYRPIRIEQG